MRKAYLPETNPTTSPDEIDELNSAAQAMQLNVSGAGRTNLQVHHGGVEVAHQTCRNKKSRVEEPVEL